MDTNGQVAALLLLTCIVEIFSHKIHRLTQKHALLSLAWASGVIAIKAQKTPHFKPYFLGKRQK